MNVTRGVMPATRTYSARWWRWLTLPMLPIDGVLLLGQQEEKSGKVQEDDYGIEEVSETALGYRKFICRKLGAAIGGEDEMYVVQIGPRNSACSCTAGRVRNEVCRHRDGIAALIAVGLLPIRRMEGAH